MINNLKFIRELPNPDTVKALLPLTEADALSPLPPERIYYEGDGYAALRGEAGGERA